MREALASFYGTFLSPINTVVFVYFVALAVFYIVLYISASLDMRQYLRQVRAESDRDILSSEMAPSITVLVPAHNEEETIEQSIRALLTLVYPDLQIVVVDDGSTDDTVTRLVEAFDLVSTWPIYEASIETEPVDAIYRSGRFPNLVVAAKKQGGKADALNLALNLAETELVCAVDADTILDPDGLRRLVRPFLRSDDVAAAGATIRVANGCTVRQGRLATERGPHQLLAGIQVVEYLRAFLFGRPGWNRLGGNLVISGAFGLFRRQTLLDVDGYAKTVGEDMELIVRIRRSGYERGIPSRIEFVPDPVAWTEAPISLSVLSRQRERWHRGFSDSLWRHRRVCLNPRYGVLGMVVYPCFVLFEWLAPIIELIGLILVPIGLLVGEVSPFFAVLFFALALGLGILLSMLALFLEEVSFRRYGRARDRALLIAFALLESFGYRQLTLYWRLRGIVNFIRGKRSWGSMNRKGFVVAEPAQQATAGGRSNHGVQRKPAAAVRVTP